MKPHLSPILLLAFIGSAVTMIKGQGPGMQQIPASPNVTELNEYTFNGMIADGRVWFVEFYADWCRSCRRIATHVSMLADNLTADAPGIVVARLDCDKAESFCNDVIRIKRTPTFKVYHNGKYAITYRSDFYFFDMMHSFITKVAADLMGYEIEPPPGAAKSEPTSSSADDEDEDEDDEYADDDDIMIL